MTIAKISRLSLAGLSLGAALLFAPLPALASGQDAAEQQQKMDEHTGMHKTCWIGASGHRHCRWHS